MSTLQNLTLAQLQKAVSIKEEIEKLEGELAGLSGGGGSPLPVSVKRLGGYKRSKAARMAMAAAQRARWAKLKGAKAGASPKKRRKMSAAGRAKIAAAARARWAKAKAAGKNKL